MPDTKNIDLSSQSTLAKLQEVDSELAIQEAHLLSQLESLQEKRSSLKTVISLFTADDRSLVRKQEEVIVTPQEKPSLISEPEVEGEQEPDTPALAATVPTAKTTKSKKAASSLRNSKKVPPSKRSTKVSKDASEWQQYIREDYEKASLTQAVTSVLQSQTERVWGISDILNEMFGEDLPQAVESKLRHQVSNVLGGGARENKWYRGQPGSYSFSKKASEKG